MVWVILIGVVLYMIFKGGKHSVTVDREYLQNQVIEAENQLLNVKRELFKLEQERFQMVQEQIRKDLS